MRLNQQKRNVPTRAAVFARLFLLLGLLAVACGCGGDGPEEIAALESEKDQLAETSDHPIEQVSASNGGSSWPEDDYQAAYFHLFGAEAVVEAHRPQLLGEIEIPELRGLAHTLTEVDVSRVAYLKEIEEDGLVEVTAISEGPLTVFEVFNDGPPTEEESIFFGLDDKPFLAVLDYGWGNAQADATGGWHSAVVATQDEAGHLSFHGTLGPVAAAFFAAARQQFVPSRYDTDEALLVAIVSEAAASFIAGQPGELGTAVIDSLS